MPGYGRNNRMGSGRGSMGNTRLTRGNGRAGRGGPPTRQTRRNPNPRNNRETIRGGRAVSDHTHPAHYHSAYVPNTGQGYMDYTGPPYMMNPSGGHSHGGNGGNGQRGAPTLPPQPRSGTGRRQTRRTTRGRMGRRY